MAATRNRLQGHSVVVVQGTIVDRCDRSCWPIHAILRHVHHDSRVTTLLTLRPSQVHASTTVHGQRSVIVGSKRKIGRRLVEGAARLRGISGGWGSARKHSRSRRKKFNCRDRGAK